MATVTMDISEYNEMRDELIGLRRRVSQMSKIFMENDIQFNQDEDEYDEMKKREEPEEKEEIPEGAEDWANIEDEL